MKKYNQNFDKRTNLIKARFVKVENRLTKKQNEWEEKYYLSLSW
jgi:hypothetical protein